MKKATKKASKTLEKINTSQTIRLNFWQRKYFLHGLIFLFSFALYTNSIGHDYNMDDELVTINHRLTSQGITSIPQIFTSPYYQDESGYSYEYRPVVLVSFAIEHQFFGDNPHVSHFFNVLLYSVMCVLLFEMLSVLFSKYSILFSVAISLIFAAHTAHTEVVSSIKNRDEILGMFFSLLSFYFSIRYIIKKQVLLLILVFGFFLLSLLSKLTFITFAMIIPFALLIFYHVSFRDMILLVLILFTPSIYLQPSLSGFTKLILLLLCILGTVLLYFVKHSPEIIKKVFDFKNEYLNSRNFIWKQNESHFDSKLFLKDTIPSFQNFSGKRLLLVLVPLFIFFIGIHYEYLFFSVSGIFMLSFLLFRKENDILILAHCAFFIILLSAFSHLASSNLHKIFYLELFSIPLIYIIVFGDRRLFFPSLITFLLLQFFCYKYFFINGTSASPFLYLLSIFCLKFKRGWIVTCLFIIINLSALFIEIFSVGGATFINIILDQVPFISSVILVAFIVLKWNTGILIRVYLLVSVIISLGSIESSSRPPVEIIKTVDKFNPSIIAKTQNRPVLYLEQCIDFNKTPLSIRLATSLEILYFYLYKVVIPYPLSYYYGYKFIEPMKMTDSIPLTSLIIHLLLLAIAIYFLNIDIIVSFAIFLYFISVSIYSNFFQGVPGMVADRFLLVPSLGWSILLVSLIQRIFSFDFLTKNLSFDAIPRQAKYAFTVILLFYSVLTFSRNEDWKTYITLFRHDIKYVKNSAQAHNLLGLRLMKESYNVSNQEEQISLRQEALSHFKQAIEIYPPFFNATYDIARVYSILNFPDSALVYYEKSTKLDSSFSDSYLAAGEILFRENKVDDARHFFEKIIALYPNAYVGYDKVSYTYFYQKEYSKSREINFDARNKMPGDAHPCLNLAKTYYAEKNMDSTNFWLNKALEINPNYQEAQAFFRSIHTK